MGTSVVTSGDQQNLILNPGNYSKDPDGFEFNSSDWKYEYFCRIYSSVDQLVEINSFFQSNQFEYNKNQSSLTIFANDRHWVTHRDCFEIEKIDVSVFKDV